MSLIISLSYSLELLSLAIVAFALLLSRYPPWFIVFFYGTFKLLFIVNTFIFYPIFLFVHRLSTYSSFYSSSIEGLGRFRFLFTNKLLLFYTDQSYIPLNYSYNLKFIMGELPWLLFLMTDMPEIERPSLATDWESEKCNFDSSAIKATFRTLRESE